VGKEGVIWGTGTGARDREAGTGKGERVYNRLDNSPMWANCGVFVWWLNEGCTKFSSNKPIGDKVTASTLIACHVSVYGEMRDRHIKLVASSATVRVA